MAGDLEWAIGLPKTAYRSDMVIQEKEGSCRKIAAAATHLATAVFRESPCVKYQVRAKESTVAPPRPCFGIAPNGADMRRMRSAAWSSTLWPEDLEISALYRLPSSARSSTKITTAP